MNLIMRSVDGGDDEAEKADNEEEEGSDDGVYLKDIVSPQCTRGRLWKFIDSSTFSASDERRLRQNSW